MSNTIKLLDKARSFMPRQSKRALAIRLGMDDGNLRRIYRGHGFPNPVHCERLAVLLGMEAIEVIRYVQEDKTRSESERQFLKDKLPRILPTIGLSLCAIVGAALMPQPARASQSVNSIGCVSLQPIHYAQCRVMRFTKRLRSLIHRLRHRLYLSSGASPAPFPASTRFALAAA